MDHKTKEHELAEIRERHAQELAKAEREADIRFALPIPPRFVHIYPRVAWITYKAPVAVYPKPPEATISEALEILDTLPPEVALMRKSGCLSVSPADLMTPGYLNGEDRGESLVSLHCQIGRGFGPDWSLQWFTRHHKAGWLHVHVEVQPPNGVKAYVRVKSWVAGEPNAIAKHADPIPGAKLITWGGGTRDHGVWSWHFSETDSLRELAR